MKIKVGHRLGLSIKERIEMNKVTFIRERMEMGITSPFICQVENGQWFVVKTTAMMPMEQLLAETIGTALAIEIGLPCPPFCFVDIPKQASEYTSPEWQPMLPAGLAFASEHIAQAKVAKTVQAKNPRYFPEDLQKLLYMFDRWILNSDRAASNIGTGNINLLFNEWQQKIFVIDHNLAFDECATFDEHIFAPANRDWKLDWVDKQLFTDKAIDILNNFDHIYQNIPDKWFLLDDENQEIDDCISKIKTLLNRINEEHYWDDIE
ncbi:Putative Toxin-antitoxin system, toxin component,HipA family [Avibacterium paragallinarum JF4211]|nr:Putative Toxin-antitoxin system, toxin component,HipA family [Avibacterium paragallinarum JF4211]